MKKIAQLTTGALTVASSLLFTASVFAQQTINPTFKINNSDVGLRNVSNLISAGVTLFLIIAIIAALFFLIWGGVQWITSGGDKAATQAARDRITAALVGLVVVFAAWLLLTVAGNFLGFSFTTLVIPSAVTGQ